MNFHQICQNQGWTFLYSELYLRIYSSFKRIIVTYSRPVLPYKPKVVAEEGQDTDAEHGRHKKKEQDVKFGLGVWQVILREETGGESKREESNDVFMLRNVMEEREENIYFLKRTEQ